MRKSLVFLVVFVLMINLFLQGCATMPNKRFTKQDTTEIEPLKLVRYDTAPLRAYKTGSMIAAIVVPGILIGGIGAGLGYLIHNQVTIEPKNPNIPDFGKMIVTQFNERAKKEIPQWPNMSIADEPVVKDYVNDNLSYIVELNIEDIRIEMDSGIVIESIITMKDKSNEVIWEKGYKYDAFYFQRLKNYDTLMRDDCKLLKEEYEFAAEKTVSDFIMHFNDSLSDKKNKIANKN